MRVVTEDCVGCPHSEDGDDGFVYYGSDKCVYKDVEEDETNCLNTDWLFNDSMQLLISPSSSYFEDSFAVYEPTYGYNIGSGSVEHPMSVRPVAVLKSDVTKLEGEGTSGNPYKLGLGT